MPKQSREQIIAELDARKAGYSEGMSYNELCELLRKAQAEVSVAKAKSSPPPAAQEESIDYSKVRCGMATIQDHERRIVLIERRIEKMLTDELKRMSHA